MEQRSLLCTGDRNGRIHCFSLHVGLFHNRIACMAFPTPDETILGLLAVEARHGYELLSSFHSNTQLGRVWRMSTSQLYAVLKRLERQGAIVGRAVLVENAPPRTQYRLTELGTTRLMAWLNDPAPSPTIRRVRVEFLSRLYILRLLNLPTEHAVRYQRDACLRERSHLDIERCTASPGVDLLAIDFVIEQLDAVLRWLARCELTPNDADIDPLLGGAHE
jgi:DNA-binding PadR family transcriptional regulator